MSTIALPVDQRPGDQQDIDPPPEALSRNLEGGEGSWQEFQAARRRYLKALSQAGGGADADEPPPPR